MAALADDKVMFFGAEASLHVAAFAVLTNTVIFKGAGVCSELAVGYTRPVAASLTGPSFEGFALERANNNPGASGALRVRCTTEGIVFVSAIAGAAGVADKSKAVYMSDDQTFTLTSTNNVLIGDIVDYDGTYFLVHYRAAARI